MYPDMLFLFASVVEKQSSFSTYYSSPSHNNTVTASLICWSKSIRVIKWSGRHHSFHFNGMFAVPLGSRILSSGTKTPRLAEQKVIWTGSKNFADELLWVIVNVIIPITTPWCLDSQILIVRKMYHIFHGDSNKYNLLENSSMAF